MHLLDLLNAGVPYSALDPDGGPLPSGITADMLAIIDVRREQSETDRKQFEAQLMARARGM